MEIKKFENSEFGSVRTVDVNGVIHFVAKDVALALGYANTRDAVAKRVDDEDKIDGVAICDSIGRKQEVTVINESGLYSLILSSKLPNAKKFKRWVTSEILPSIRQTGSYGNLNIEEIIAKTATAVAVEIAKQFINGSMPTVQQENKPVKRIAKAYKYTTPSKISTLPPEVKERVDEMLISGEFSCQSVANFIINSTGIYISQMSVNRYKRNNFIL